MRGLLKGSRAKGNGRCWLGREVEERGFILYTYITYATIRTHNAVQHTAHAWRVRENREKWVEFSALWIRFNSIQLTFLDSNSDSTRFNSLFLKVSWVEVSWIESELKVPTFDHKWQWLGLSSYSSNLQSKVQAFNYQDSLRSAGSALTKLE